MRSSAAIRFPMPDRPVDAAAVLEAWRRYEVLRSALERMAEREICENCWAVEEAREALEEAGHS